MIPFLLKLFGVKIDQALKIASVALEFRNGGAIRWAFFVALALGTLAWWSYRYRAGDRALPTGRRRVLTTLRVMLYLLLLTLMLRPVLSFTVEGEIRRMVLVLLDTSTSMNIQDPRLDEADLKRAAIGKGFLKSLDQSLDANRAGEVRQISRTALLKAVLENPDLGILPKLRANFDVNVFGFGQTVTELSATPADAAGKGGGAPAYAAESPLTALGDAVREVIGRKRGQPIAGIVLATDGASNSGSPPLDAANLAKEEGAPLYIYGTGITSPRDIIVGNLFTPEIAFVKDELKVTVRVRGQGMKGQRARLILKLGENQVEAKDLDFTVDEEQIVPLSFTPLTAGEFELSASIAPREDETVKDNNSVAQRIKVIDSKIKVLYVEQAPRWEFRYLQAVLLRDRRMETKCVLLEGAPSIAAGEGSPYLAKFPATKEELFKYDLVIVGEVDSKTFTPPQLDALNEFVSKFGGAALFIAGRKWMPRAYKDTPVEKMLPVELDMTAEPPQTGERPITLELTPAGRTNPMLHLAPKDEESAEEWKRIPPIYWESRVARAKPAAQVLLVDPDPAKASRFGKMPVIAMQQYGLGQVLYVGTDNTWRWRRNGKLDIYATLWGQVTQRMALAHLLGGAKRTQLTMDKQNYNTGDKVSVYARLYTEGFEPVKETAVEAFYKIKAEPGKAPAGSGEKQSVQLRAVPEQPGIFRGDFVATAPGAYEFGVAIDPKTLVGFGVTEPKFELGETAMNEALLRGMATASGGAFFREEDLGKLAGTIKEKNRAGVKTVIDAEIWSSPLFFGLVLATATAEWILRRRSRLK